MKKAKFNILRNISVRAAAVLLAVLLAAGAAYGCRKSESGTTDNTPAPGTDPGDNGYVGEDGVLRIYPRPKNEEIGTESIDAGTLTLEFSGFDADAGKRCETALTGAGFKLGSDGTPVKFINNKEFGAEEYALRIDSEGVRIEAGGIAGGLNAVATLRQLRKDDKLTCAKISDSPDVPLRGVIEGFYGVAWTHEFRLDLFRFMGKYKLNTYIYAPKDDAKHRAQWRRKYTGKELEKMEELIRTAAENNVNFVYALSPGLDIKLGDGYEEDFQALSEKCESMYALGVRYFALLLDDIDSRDAAGHAKLLNDFQTKFIETHKGAADLIAITPEFCTAMLTGYTDEFAPLLNEKIMLMWTGTGVIPATMPRSSLTGVNKQLGRKVFIWWNYPVNDTMADNLFMAPCTGLDKNLCDYVSGLTANPMNQGYASLAPLFTVADFLWNNAGYDAEQSITAAANLLEPACGSAYKAFIDLQRASVITNNRSEFSASDELRRYRKNESSAADIETLAKTFEKLSAQLAELRSKGSPELIKEIDRWLSKAEAYAGMGSALFRLEQAAASGAGNTEKAEIAAAYVQAKTALSGNSRVVSPDILTPFFAATDSRVNELLGISASSDASYTPTVTSNLPVYDVYYKDNAVDGSEDTYFWSAGAPSIGSNFVVDLGSEVDVTRVYLHMGASGHADDYMRNGVVEYSADGRSWTKLGELSGPSFEQEAELTLRYLRLRCTRNQTYWLIITEFGAELARGELTDVTVDSTPSRALYAVVDGNITTCYESASGAAGSMLRIKTGDSARISLYFTRLDKADGRFRIYCELTDGTSGPDLTPDYCTEVNTEGCAALCVVFGDSPACLAEVVRSGGYN